MANDIRDILKGLSPEHRAIYAETRTAMRRAYLYAHSKTLPIDEYDESDDAFLDLIDIRIAQLFDRSGSFNHVDGHLATEQAKEIENEVKLQRMSPLIGGKGSDMSDATKLMKNDGWKQAAQ